MTQIEGRQKKSIYKQWKKKTRPMPLTARTPVKGNAHNCEMDDNNHDKGTKKKTSKERNDEMNRVCTADSREICRTCRLRVVETK